MKQVCDRKCFECKFDDCIEETITKDEFDRQQQMDAKVKVRKRVVSQAEREKNKIRAKEYYYTHREQCKEKNKKYYNTHKEKFKEYDRIRKQTHHVSPEKRHEYYIRWRDKKKANEQSL